MMGSLEVAHFSTHWLLELDYPKWQFQVKREIFVSKNDDEEH